jgi:FtsH-binding integral membrane protein
VLLFAGLTAYDTQKLLALSTQAQNAEDEGRISIYGALELYLDFINLFLALLRLFGRRK